MYIDAHTHLFHERFSHDADDAARRAQDAGVTKIIVNGLEPQSNDATLALCDKHDNLIPALGIYPVQAIAHKVDSETWSCPFPAPTPFDVDAELTRIDARAPGLVAIGECGLDAYWTTDHFEEQERVFRALCRIAVRHDKPMILHTRKAEERSFEILVEEGVERANFHCFGGKSRLAQQIAERGYYFSIPPVAERAENFRALARKLPMSCLLTETDAPYMAADRGERNEPSEIPRAVAAIADVRGMTVEAVRSAVAANFERLFRVAV